MAKSGRIDPNCGAPVSALSIVPRHEEDRSFNNGILHLWAPPVVKTPAWATHERLTGLAAGDTVVADCCLCKMRADETVCEIVYPLPLPLGLTDAEYRERIWDNYSESYQDIQCAPGFGCNVLPRRKSSRHLREDWYES